VLGRIPLPLLPSPTRVGFLNKVKPIKTRNLDKAASNDINVTLLDYTFGYCKLAA
jgi:hypothetical protein